jgi:hypothetical protein
MKAFLLLFAIAVYHILTVNVIAQTNQPSAIHIGAVIKQYNYEKYNQVTHTNELSFTAREPQKIGTSNWQVQLKATPLQHALHTTEYVATFICVAGSLNSASVGITLNVTNWQASNYVLMPASVYNGNRYAWRRLRYSPKLHDIKDIGPDKPIIINDVPKLSDSTDISYLQERSGSMSTPAVGYMNEQQQQGVWLLTEQSNQQGDIGISIAENRTKTTATISLNSPVVRELYTYTITNAHTPSWDVPAHFKAGDSITFRFRIYHFNAPDIQHLFNTFSTIRKEVVTDTTVRNVLPFSEVFATLEQKMNRFNFVPEHGYYAVGMRENFLQDWQIGWTGGMISTYPLLFNGDSITQQQVIRNFNWLFPKGISPSGFYWDAGQKGTEWFGGDIRNTHTKNWHLIRKSGDAVWYIIKQFMLMEQKGITVQTHWKNGNKRVCDAFVQLWNKHRQLGQFIHSETGDVIVGGSTSGAIVPAALTLAAKYYNEHQYLQVAQAIARYYYETFTRKGITNGGPGDALQAFDSESSYALVESYTTLYEHTKDSFWLQAAQDAAHQFATWVVSYNYRYNDTTAFAKLKIATVGGVYANIQNKHSAPGICTASGIALLKLYRYTNNPFFLQLLFDIAHNTTQYLPHPYNKVPNTPTGWVTERINMTDWEGPQSIGYILPLSTWAETSLMLTHAEIPGIYVDIAQQKAVAFDNVLVQYLRKNKRQIQLTITNPIPCDATIKVLIDANKQTDLQELALLKAIHLTVNAKATKTFTINIPASTVSK